MRIFLAAAACLIAAPAIAGSIDTGSGETVVMTPASSSPCSTVMVGGCGYCINGKIYH